MWQHSTIHCSTYLLSVAETRPEPHSAIFTIIFSIYGQWLPSFRFSSSFILIISLVHCMGPPTISLPFPSPSPCFPVQTSSLTLTTMSIFRLHCRHRRLGCATFCLAALSSVRFFSVSTRLGHRLELLLWPCRFPHIITSGKLLSESIAASCSHAHSFRLRPQAVGSNHRAFVWRMVTSCVLFLCRWVP